MKNTLKCRGARCRESIVEKYNLEILRHTKLLANQTQTSCTGDKLINSYYIFKCTSKADPSDTKQLICGSLAAQHFITLANIKPVSIFNPLMELKTPSSNDRTNLSPSQSNKSEWDPHAKQLYEAISLIEICWNTVLVGFLDDIRTNILKNKHQCPPTKHIKAVNTILSNSSSKKRKDGQLDLTLSLMISNLKKSNDLRDFSFALLENTLKEINIKSFF